MPTVFPRNSKGEKRSKRSLGHSDFCWLAPSAGIFRPSARIMVITYSAICGTAAPLILVTIKPSFCTMGVSTYRSMPAKWNCTQRSAGTCSGIGRMVAVYRISVRAQISAGISSAREARKEAMCSWGEMPCRRLSSSSVKGTVIRVSMGMDLDGWWFPGHGVPNFQTGVPIDQQRTHQHGGDDKQPGLRAECTARPDFGPADSVQQQAVGFESAYWKAKHHTLEEVPANVQADREPQLAGEQIGQGQEQARQQDAQGRDPGCAWITEMEQREHG